MGRILGAFDDTDPNISDGGDPGGDATPVMGTRRATRRARGCRNTRRRTAGNRTGKVVVIEEHAKSISRTESRRRQIEAEMEGRNFGGVVVRRRKGSMPSTDGASVPRFKDSPKACAVWPDRPIGRQVPLSVMGARCSLGRWVKGVIEALAQRPSTRQHMSASGRRSQNLTGRSVSLIPVPEHERDHVEGDETQEYGNLT